MNNRPKTTPSGKPILGVKAGREMLKAQPEAPEGLLYYVIGSNVWGRAKTALEAYRNSGNYHGTYGLHLVNKDAEVDSISGGLNYNSQTPGVKLEIAYFHA